MSFSSSSPRRSKRRRCNSSGATRDADGAGSGGVDLSSQDPVPSIAKVPLACMDDMRMQDELCDLLLRAEQGGAGRSRAEDRQKDYMRW